jgi:site-specific DNA recombinase
MYRTMALREASGQSHFRSCQDDKEHDHIGEKRTDAHIHGFTPSYTVKNGRRYRYYVCVPKPKKGQHPAATRLPAHDIEKHVIAKLRSFWQSAANVLDQVTLPSEGAGEIQNLVVSADKLASRWPTLSRDEGRELIRGIVTRVVVHNTKIEIEISKKKLRNVLGANAYATSGVDPEQGQLHEQDLIRLNIEAKLARRGLEVRLMVPPGPDTEALAGPPAPSLVKAVARAYGWHERILQGAAFDQRSLAEHSGLSRRYVGRVLEGAFLAPDIVEAILQGRQPPGLTFEKLGRPLPLSWVEQREQLGFPKLVFT